MNQCKLKVAELGLFEDSPDFIRCIKYFEEVADSYLESKLSAPSARELYFKSMLLYLALDDSIGCRKSLEKYCDADPSLANSRHEKLIQGMLKAFDEKSHPVFKEAVQQFVAVMPMDNWKKRAILMIEQHLAPETAAPAPSGPTSADPYDCT